MLGAIPGLPKVHLHNPVLAYEVGDEFMNYWYLAEKGKLDPFVLVVEGSIPNEKIKKEGYWAALGTNPDTGQPITTCEWIDRLAPKALAVVACGTCATYGGIHAMQGNPDRLPWAWPIISAGTGKRKAGLADRQCSRLPGPARQLHGNAALSALSGGRTGADDSAGRAACGRNGCSAARCTKAAIGPAITSKATSPQEYGSPKCIVKLGCWGPVVNCNVPKRGWMAGIGGCPNVGGICIGCTMPGFPDKFMPFMDEPPGAKLSSTVAKLYGEHGPQPAAVSPTTR